MRVLSNLVAWCIVTYIQHMMTSHSHLGVKLCHNLMVNLFSHPGILWCIPVDSHVLYLHFVLLFQVLWSLWFTYNNQLFVVGSIHVCNKEQCKSVFTFCRTCWLVTIKAACSVREGFVEQSCFITIVDIAVGVGTKCWDEYCFPLCVQFFLRCWQCSTTTNSVIHNAVPFCPTVNIHYICSQSGCLNCFTKL